MQGLLCSTLRGDFARDQQRAIEAVAQPIIPPDLAHKAAQGRCIQTLELMFGAFSFVVITQVIFVAVCVPFLEAVKEESPATYSAWGNPSALGLILRKRAWWPFSGMVLSRQYRTALAGCPRSRAWASWLHVAQWLQLGGLAVFVVSIFLGGR